MTALLLLSVPAAAQGQFNFVTNNGAITITGYTGPGGAVTIPGHTNGLPVTCVGNEAFYNCGTLTSVLIPKSVTNIGTAAFEFCSSLTSLAIPRSVTSIGHAAFWGCSGLTAITVDALNPAYSSLAGVLFDKRQTTLIAYPGGKAGPYTIPNSATKIGSYAFCDCYLLTSVNIGNRVISIEDGVFSSCAGLNGVWFQGNAPSAGSHVFNGANNATVYYLPGTTGWSTTFGGRPTALWLLANPVILASGPNFGVQTNAFGFTISWATNLSIIVEACTDLANPLWVSIATNALTAGWSHFTDRCWTNYPVRFYRVRSP